MTAYTGVGSRRTPTPIKMRMSVMARRLSQYAVLRSGAAPGADRAFEKGCGVGRKEIYLPWEGFEGRTSAEPGVIVPDRLTLASAEKLVEEIHPGWDHLKRGARMLHVRNVYQVLGADLDDPSRFLICWTPEGKLTGGTRTALLVAARHGVPCFNLGSKDWTLREIVERVTKFAVPQTEGGR